MTNKISALELLKNKAYTIEAQARRGLIDALEAHATFTSYLQALEDTKQVIHYDGWEVYQTFSIAIVGTDNPKDMQEAKAKIRGWKLDYTVWGEN